MTTMNNIETLNAAGFQLIFSEPLNVYAKDLPGGQHVEIADADGEGLSPPKEIGPVTMIIISCPISDLNDPDSPYNDYEIDDADFIVSIADYMDAASALLSLTGLTD